MRFVKIPVILPTVADPECIRKRICDGTGFSNNIFLKEFFDNSFFMLFSLQLQFHETPTKVGLKMLQTVCKRTLCEPTYFK